MQREILRQPVLGRQKGGAWRQNLGIPCRHERAPFYEITASSQLLHDLNRCESGFGRAVRRRSVDPESTDLERFVGFHGMLTLGTSLFDFSFFGKTYGNMNCLRSEVCSRTPAPVLRSVQRLTCICKTSKRLAAASDRHLAPAKFPQSFSCRQ